MSYITKKYVKLFGIFKINLYLCIINLIDTHTKLLTMITIGFATKMFTLWNVYEREEFGTGYGGEIYSYTRVFNDYIQNLSLDLETAKAKAIEYANGEEINVDLNLRGKSSFTYTKGEPKIIPPYDQFPYGKLMGENIYESNDLFQLNRLYNDHSVNGRSRVLARKKLIELGELVRIENEFYSEDYNRYIGSTNYESFKNGIIIDRALGGHHFNDGEKVTLKVKEVGSFSFSNNYYGTTYVVTYIDSENRKFKYVGSSPKTSVEDGWIEIKATIKHDSYHGEAETKLLRIKKI